MKKHLIMLVALFVAIAIAAPAMAAVEFKYGGQFRARYIAQNNFTDGDDAIDDHNNFFDQRLRLFFTFKASENLKLVTKFEMGDTAWGNGNVLWAGGRVGADQVIVELKNAYIDFNIPCTPTEMLVGIQTVTLMDSWIIDDDFAGIVAVTKLDPFTITAGYLAGQNTYDRVYGGALGSNYGLRSYPLFSGENENIDDFLLAVDYKAGPFSASFVALYQMGHNTMVSADPNSLVTPQPATGYVPLNWPGNGPYQGNMFGQRVDRVENNNLWDLGLKLQYKVDWMSAYVDFVKNLGSVDYAVSSDPVLSRGSVRDEEELQVGNGKVKSHDYKGWMVDAGATFFQGPWTFNVGGFYLSGPKTKDVKVVGEGTDGEGQYTTRERQIDIQGDIDWFTYPLATAKYFSEIMGGGILDNGAPQRQDIDSMWRGFWFPMNIWTVTAGTSYQVMEKTKLSLSYWYFGTSEKVEAGCEDGRLQYSNELGHEIDFYITQGIVDGLTLDIVAAYMFTGDAFQEKLSAEDPADVYELGARLQWNF